MLSTFVLVPHCLDYCCFVVHFEIRKRVCLPVLVGFFLFMATPAAYGSSRSNQSCSCRPTPQAQQHQIWAASLNTAVACSATGSLTLWAGPGIEPTSSWRQCRVLNPLSHNQNSSFIHLFQGCFADFGQIPKFHMNFRIFFLSLQKMPFIGIALNL